jgi:hypothetical protein
MDGPAMISVLAPSRGRPAIFARMLDSLYATCANPCGIEVISYLDVDDPTAPGYRPANKYLTYIIGPRVIFSDLWNQCYLRARGDILMHAGDDQLFDTPAWDELIENAYLSCPDRILMVHGSDLQHCDRFGAILCLSRRWVDTVGYVVPPYFVGDGPDNWINDTANALGRRLYLPYVIRHLNPIWNTAPDDATYAERRVREASAPKNLYESDMMAALRAKDVEKLRAVMDSSWTMTGLRSTYG